MSLRSGVGAVRQRYEALAMLVLVTGLMGGCGTLPNTSGYTDATIQVKQAVATTGEAVEAELTAAVDGGATTANSASVAKFNAAWAETVQSLDAMVVYAQSIEQIVDAGDKGAESAKQVAESVKRLVDVIKVVPVGAAAAGLIQLSTDTVAFVHGEYSKFAAAKSLIEALDQVGPSMTKISKLVKAQVTDARSLFIQQIEAQVLELRSDTSGYGGWLKRNSEMDAQAQIAFTALVKSIKTDNASDIAKAKTLTANTEMVRTQIAPRILEYQAKLHLIRQRDKAGRSIFGAAENAIVGWGLAHHQLVEAVKQRKPVSVDALIAAVVEIRTLTQRWRDL